jgi:membrane peptidoglycan carboxypeptidase
MPRKLPQALRAFALTTIIGGVAVGACLAALIPGTETLVASQHFSSDKLAKLSKLDQRSTIYDAAGNVIATLGTENREEVKLSEVPKVLQDAVIAVEDKTFRTNDGVDLNGVFRAFLKNVSSGEIAQGGSTISQQLVKNRILTNKRDVKRKVKEIVLALRLNEKFSKDEILEQYLNTVYFGQGSYGVKAAVERFFLANTPLGPVPAVQLKDVNIGQAALLAGLISNPEGNNPFVNPEGARERRKLALDAMVTQKVINPATGAPITQAEADAAAAEPLPTLKPPAELRPHNSWSEEIQDRLFNDPLHQFSALGKTKQQRQQAVLTGGLKIYATLDPVLQADAQAAVNQGLANAKRGFTAALVSMDPQTGEVKAMVAGPGFEQSQYNIATSYVGRQAGSTWKVITLAAALESGFSPNDRVLGTSPCKFSIGQTQNAEGGGGLMTLRDATRNSVNCAFARTELAVGFPKVIDTAKRMGIKQDGTGANGTIKGYGLKPVLTLTLGAVETAPLEMATVAATIASGGVEHDPLFVSKIVQDGEVVFDAKDIPGKRAISADAAACETDLMRGVVERGGTGGAARLNGRQTAGKTGTTDNKKDANFLGFTPQLATFVWHGSPVAGIPGAGFGGGIPAGIFKRYMDAALAGQPAIPFPSPGPFCARPGAAITENGRVATVNGLFPGETTLPIAPPTVVTTPTIPPSTTTTAPCPSGSPNPDPPPFVCP